MLGVEGLCVSCGGKVRRQQNTGEWVQDVDEGLVGAWLDDPDLAAELADELEQLERLRRLQADEELLLALTRQPPRRMPRLQPSHRTPPAAPVPALRRITRSGMQQPR